MTDTNPLDVLVPGTHHKVFLVAAVAKNDGRGAAAAYFDLTDDQVHRAMEYRQEHAAAFQSALKDKETVHYALEDGGLDHLCRVVEKMIQYWIPNSDDMTLNRNLFIVANQERRQDLEGDAVSDEAILWAYEVQGYASLIDDFDYVTPQNEDDPSIDDDNILFTADLHRLLPRIRAAAMALIEHYSRKPDETFPANLVQKVEQLLPFLDDRYDRRPEIVTLARVLMGARRTRIKALKIHPRELARLLDGLTQLIHYTPSRYGIDDFTPTPSFVRRVWKLRDELADDNISDEAIQRAETVVKAGRDMGIIDQVVDDD